MPGQQQIKTLEDGTVILKCNEHEDVVLGKNLSQHEKNVAGEQHRKLPHRA